MLLASLEKRRCLEGNIIQGYKVNTAQKLTVNRVLGSSKITHIANGHPSCLEAKGVVDEKPSHLQNVSPFTLPSCVRW